MARWLLPRGQKTAIHDFPDDTLERVMKLKPVSFRMMKGGNGVEYGFIAQDVELLFPELVRDREHVLSLSYIGLMAPMVKAMQELKSDSDNWRREFKAANDNFAVLKSEVEGLKKSIAAGQR